MKFSIIVPVYNVEKYIERAVNSLLKQTYTNYEIFLVNDGSEDRSGEICDKFAQEYECIYSIYQTNQGSGIARQNGINKATGDYVVFLDPDDYMKDNALEEYNNLLKSNPNIELLFNGYNELIKINEGHHDIISHFYDMEGALSRSEFIENFKDISKISIRALWNKVYSLKFLRENDIHFTNQRIGQDALFNYQVYRYVSHIYISKGAYYVYDTTRDGSAVKRYHPDKWQYEYNIAQSFENLINSWGASDELRELSIKEYWYAIYYFILNIGHSDNHCTLLQKRAQLIHVVADDSKIKQIIKELHIGDVKTGSEKLILTLLKAKQYLLAIIFVNAWSNL